MEHRERRAQLSQEVIVDAVLDLAHEGSKEVTYKEIGHHLGVDATAMYRHFRNKEELIRACLDRIHASVAEQVLSHGGSWRQRIENFVIGVLDGYAAYPAIGLYGISLDPRGQGENAAIELILDALLEAGTPESELVETYGAISALMLSFGAVTAQWNVAQGRSGHVDAEWITELGQVDPEIHPHVHEYRNQLLTVKFRDIFSRAFNALLDSIDPDALIERPQVPE